MLRKANSAAWFLPVIFFLWAFPLSASDQHSWPQTKKIHRSYIFEDLGKASVAFEILNSRGKPLYWFGCHSSDFIGQPRDPFHDDEWFYYGSFDCHLHSLIDKSGNNLLSYNASDPRENFSRALTVTKQLTGRCAQYPDWGLLRHIRVRGMLITLQFGDLHFAQVAAAVNDRNPDGTVLHSFKFDVQIEPDKSAVFSFAEIPQFAYPLQVSPGSAKNISDDCAELIPERGKQ